MPLILPVALVELSPFKPCEKSLNTQSMKNNYYFLLWRWSAEQRTSVTALKGIYFSPYLPHIILLTLPQTKTKKRVVK